MHTLYDLFSLKFLYYSDMTTQKHVQKFVEVEGNLGHKKVLGELDTAAFVHPCGEGEVLHMAHDLPKLTFICYHSTQEFMA
jgi:hypothetical protein